MVTGVGRRRSAAPQLTRRHGVRRRRTVRAVERRQPFVALGLPSSSPPCRSGSTWASVSRSSMSCVSSFRVVPQPWGGPPGRLRASVERGSACRLGAPPSIQRSSLAAPLAVTFVLPQVPSAWMADRCRRAGAPSPTGSRRSCGRQEIEPPAHEPEPAPPTGPGVVADASRKRTCNRGRSVRTARRPTIEELDMTQMVDDTR